MYDTLRILVSKGFLNVKGPHRMPSEYSCYSLCLLFVWTVKLGSQILACKSKQKINKKLAERQLLFWKTFKLPREMQLFSCPEQSQLFQNINNNNLKKTNTCWAMTLSTMLTFPPDICRTEESGCSFPAAGSSSRLQQVFSAGEHNSAHGRQSGPQCSSECGKMTQMLWLLGFMIASDRPRLSQLDQMILGKSVNMLDVSEAHKQSIQPVLEVLKEVEGVSAAQMEGPVSVLSALHLITSALGGEHDFFFFFFNISTLYWAPHVLVPRKFQWF